MVSSVNPPSVRVTQEGTVAVIIIDNPPVNSSTDQVRKGLLQALADIDQDNTSVLLLAGEGPNLMAGADLSELEDEPTEPTLPQITGAIEAFPLPIIALAKGFTLGGGLELCLACDYRLASPDANLGLPEVSVGIIPGAGGTQRLPRLIGLPAAVNMIVSGKPVKADKALELGLINEILENTTESEQLSEAIEIARQYSLGKSPVSKKQVATFDKDDLNNQAKLLLKKSRGLPSAESALTSTMAASELSFEEGIKQEREIFLKLRRSTESKALRYLFFAERTPVEKSQQTPEQQIRRVSVIGAGTMGSGIAICALNSGFGVTLIDLNPEALKAGVDKISETLEKDVQSHRLSAKRKEEILNNLSYSTDLGETQDSDLVVEAIIEDLDIKRGLFEKVSKIVSEDALLATNTSYLDIDKVFDGIRSRGRTLGLHFFSPAHRMKLLEIVQSASTSRETLALACSFAKKLKKQAIVVKNSWGFVGNRLYAAYRRQCEFMLEEGASYDHIDRALERYGFAMGPFKVADMSGLDIAWKMRQQTADTRHLRRYVGIPDLLCEEGRFGRKTGKGYYRYDGNQPRPDAEVNELIDNYRAENNIDPETFTDEEIQRRAILSLINESLLLLEEGVCSQPSDIDLALVYGYGFPRWKGGPVFLANEMKPEILEEELAHLAEVSGKGHISASPKASPNI